ncbi:MAG: MBL fold metallo-hydrolase [Clostridiales bacterium]
MHITMLGVGNGFSPGVYNNNALLEAGGEKALIDCGITAWESLNSLGLSVNDIRRVFLSHIHFDHAGGLEPLALYTKYFTNQPIELIVPAPLRQPLWDNYLSAGLTSDQPGTSSPEDFFHVVAPEENQVFDLCGGITARWVKTNHVPGKFSCGLVIAEKLFYTSDMVADLALLESLYAQGVRIIFHDCTLNGSSVHAGFEKIKGYPQHIKDCLYLMHHGLLAPPFRQEGLRFLRQHQRMDFALEEGAKQAAENSAAGQAGAQAGVQYDPEMDKLVQKTIAHMKKLQSAETTGHDFHHTQRVYQMALKLGRASAKPVDMRIVALAALLHDIEDWKFAGGDETAGPRAAAAWLKTLGLEDQGIEHVKEIILDLSFKGTASPSPMKTAEGEIVQDADRLDAIGAIGVARAFATGSALGNLLFDPDLPPRTMMGKAEYKDRTVKSSTVNHFYEKLLHLKELMNTPAAKAIAEERHRFMINYLQSLYGECAVEGGLHDSLLEQYK